jgi:apolipoprotein N-acyltransferase
MKYGIPLVRVSANGISMVVEPHGAIHYETRLFEDVADVMIVRQARFETAYQKWGWIFPYLCLVLSVGMISYFFKR